MLLEHVVVVQAREQELPGVELIQGACQGPYIELGIVGVPDDDLRSSVVPTDEVVDEGAFFNGEGGTEVTQFDLLVVLRDENVVWFDVGVDDLVLPQEGERDEQLRGEALDGLQTQSGA